MPSESFTPEVIAELKWYVYRLIDPRNGETFYVGKGRGNRVFAHVHAADGLEGDALDNKVTSIREIQVAGLEVGDVIRRHGIEDERSAWRPETRSGRVSETRRCEPDQVHVVSGADGATHRARP